ncbi:MAG: TrmB family transcriptional regulator [Gemmatimonadetes bacterium]|nr:TrmB family transcriptional regulator [Gemmatimonadota bacterium]
MPGNLDLTGFGFTPTESLVYEVLIRHGPGTGYAIARSAGLARANAYSALEGLVHKGAARVEEGRPKRYRPEPPATLIARIVEHQGRSLDQLSAVLAEVSTPPSPTLVELTSLRGTAQLVSHEIARATSRVGLVAPADLFPGLTPALRKAAAAGVALSLGSTRGIDLGFGQVVEMARSIRWPGEPIVLVVDGRGAILAARLDGSDRVVGHWGTDPVLVAAAESVVDLLRG